MTGYTEFIDITGGDAARAPLVAGGLRAYYVTGSDGVEESAAQVSAAEAAGMTVLLIDQTPGLAEFAAGRADIADVESLAGTPAAAAGAIAARIRLGIGLHTLYVSYSSLPALRAAVAGLPGVCYGVANYGWSVAKAQQLLTENGDWAYCQFGDPMSNPSTLVPGTSVTLAQANADIDVATEAWAVHFIAAKAPVSPAAPSLPVYAAGSRELAYTPGTPGSAMMRGTDVQELQRFIKPAVQPASWCDGAYGPLTAERVCWYEGMRGIRVESPYGIAGPQVWANTGLTR